MPVSSAKVARLRSIVRPSLAGLGVVGLCALLGCATPPAQTASNRSLRVAPVPEELRQSLNLAPFYQKYLAAGGLPVLGSTNVSDYALLEARWILLHMLEQRPEILQIMATNRARLVVMAYTEYTTDVPEQTNRAPKIYWDRRARGLGGRISSCGEENLLNFPGDPYSTESILVHEFGHAILNQGMRAVNPGFKDRVRAAYRQAMDAGKWKNTYAAVDVEEYWAEGVQNWFDNNRENDAQHNSVNTRTELKQYDLGLASLCAEVFGERSWRYVKPMLRPAGERAHLAGFDAAQSPRFRWREYPLSATPHVQLLTEFGEVELELFPQQAPITVTNFLRYVLEGYYRGGEFFRTVTSSNQTNDAIKIQVIQGRADPAQQGTVFPPIPLERTRDTGLKHLDGTISMARVGPDTAQDNFFICVGDQPELDFGGRRNLDGQGFAAFGRVVRGMDVVRRIHEANADGQQLTPVVRIQGAFRLD